MRIIFTLSSFAFILVSTDIRQIAAHSDCSSVLCRNTTTGNVIQGKENCNEASHCCFHGKQCFLKTTNISNTASAGFDELGAKFLSEFNNTSGRKNNTDDSTISERLLITGEQPSIGHPGNVPNYGFQGNFPGSYPPGGFPFPPNNFHNYCPQFPHTCQINYGSPDDFASPVNIPYCQRIPCSTVNVYLEQDMGECLRQPGCFFDYELFQYRSMLKQAVLPGVPVCHVAIRNRAFQANALKYVQKYGPWNPLLTKCLVKEYQTEIFGGSAECHLVTMLEHFGHHAKRAGWKSITENECYLIDGCWRTSISEPRGSCIYPVQLNNIAIRSNNEKDDEDLNPRNLYGLPSCLPFTGSATGADFLSNYHTCLATGCAVNVDRNTYWKQLFSIGSTLPFFLQRYYIDLILGGRIRADNYKDMMELLLTPEGQLTILSGDLQYLHNTDNIFNLGAPYNRDNSQSYQGNNALTALSLHLNTTRRSFNLPYPSNVGHSPFPPLGNLFSNLLSPTHFSGQNTLNNLFQGYPPYQEPCPYEQVQFSNIHLTGSFEGCCDKPFCYIPRQRILSQFSGVSIYATQWSAWSLCTQTCGRGEQVRTRSCIGGECDQDTEKQQIQICNEQDCPFYGGWSQYGGCSATCGGGVKTRTRHCYGDGPCSGPARNSVSCKTGACPTFRKGNWSECNVDCGRGRRVRTIFCEHGGKYGCPTANAAEQETCEVFCGSVTYAPESCNRFSCKTTFTATCVQGDFPVAYCSPEEMRPRKELCCEGFCRFRFSACSHSYN